MTRPHNKGEGQWLTALRWLDITPHKPSTRRWIKRMLGKARRRHGDPE